MVGELNMTLAEAINDVPRVDYLRGYLGEISRAIDEDKIPVLGYHLWSLYDNMVSPRTRPRICR